MLENDYKVPVWTLATKNAVAPRITDSESMSPARLIELRTALAALVDVPLATLEAHPLPRSAVLSGGIELGEASPLAKHLSELISATQESGGGSMLETVGEKLFRFVVPAKIAAQMGGGFNTSKASSISVLRNAAGDSVQSKFISVASNMAGGPGIGTLSLAAPLIFTALAAGLNALAEFDRRGTNELLQDLKDDALLSERATLNACIASMDTAANVLLDQGRIGMSLGLGAAAFQINVGLAKAEDRLISWEKGIETFRDGRVEVQQLQKVFKGIAEDGGEFGAHVELAKLAFELNKRLVVLQAVEHAQMDPSNPFEGFTRALRRHTERVSALQERVSVLLLNLSNLEVDRSHGVRDFAFKSGEVDTILRTSRRVRALGNEIETSENQADVAIEVARRSDGSLVVMPALTVKS